MTTTIKTDWHAHINDSGYIQFDTRGRTLQPGQAWLSPSRWFHPMAIRQNAAGGGSLLIGPGDVSYPEAKAALMAALDE